MHAHRAFRSSFEQSVLVAPLTSLPPVLLTPVWWNRYRYVTDSSLVYEANHTLD
jgi:hypothetical protein